MASDLQEFIKNSPFQGGPQVPSGPSGGGGVLFAKIVVVIVVLGIIGTGVVLATRIWDPLWNPFRPSPEKVMVRMYENMEEIKSAHIEGTMEIKGVSSEDEEAGAVIKLSVDVDGSDPDDTRAKSEVELVFIEGGISLTVGIDLVFADKDMFFKINNVPPIPGMDFSFIEGQWFVMEEDPSKKGEEKDISDIFGEMLVLDKELKDEKLNGKTVYHYVFKVDEEKLREEMQETSEVTNMIIPREQDTEELEQWKDFEIHFFIGKKDELLYKISLHGEIEDEGVETDVDLEMLFSDFNKEVTIDIPKRAKSFEELMMSILGGLMGGPGAVPGPGFQQGDYRFLERRGIRGVIEDAILYFNR